MINMMKFKKISGKLVWFKPKEDAIKRQRKKVLQRLIIAQNWDDVLRILSCNTWSETLNYIFTILYIPTQLFTNPTTHASAPYYHTPLLLHLSSSCLYFFKTFDCISCFFGSSGRGIALMFNLFIILFMWSASQLILVWLGGLVVGLKDILFFAEDLNRLSNEWETLLLLNFPKLRVWRINAIFLVMIRNSWYWLIGYSILTSTGSITKLTENCMKKNWN